MRKGIVFPVPVADTIIAAVLALFTKFLRFANASCCMAFGLNVMPLKRLQNLTTRWGVFLEIFLILFDPLFGQRNGIGHLESISSWNCPTSSPSASDETLRFHSRCVVNAAPVRLEPPTYRS